MTRTTAAFLLVLAAGCGSDQAGPGATPTNFSVINGAGAGRTVKVYLDGVFAADVAAGERGAPCALFRLASALRGDPRRPRSTRGCSVHRASWRIA